MARLRQLCARLLAAVRSIRSGLAVVAGLVVVVPAYLVVLLLWRLLCPPLPESEAANWRASLGEDLER